MDYERIAQRALALYGLEGAELELMGHSDKRAYLVRTESEKYMLFLHTHLPERADYARDIPYFRPEVIMAEARLMERLAEKAPELGTQRIFRSANNALVEEIDGIAVRLTSYVEGEMLDEKGENYPAQARMAGEVCARLHDFAMQEGMDICRDIPVHRQEYFREILSALEKAHAEGRMTDAQYDAVQRGGRIILDCMDALDEAGQVGFVHTDLRSANFLSDGKRVVPIDFSRGVLGYPLFDMGEMCMHMGETAIQRQILGGYDSVRPLSESDVHCIEAFAVMFIFDICAEFFSTNNYGWLDVNLPRIEHYFVPGLENGTLVPRDFR